jgi:hypothetical protein
MHHGWRAGGGGARHAAEFDQVMPVAAVARQARGFDTKDRTDFAGAHLGHESLKARTLDQARSRSAQILVNHDNVPKAQLAGVLRQIILTAAALVVAGQLSDRGLPNVDDGAASQTFTGQLRVHRSLRLTDARRSCVRRESAAPSERC